LRPSRLLPSTKDQLELHLQYPQIKGKAVTTTTYPEGWKHSKVNPLLKKPYTDPSKPQKLQCHLLAPLPCHSPQEDHQPPTHQAPGKNQPAGHFLSPVSAPTTASRLPL
ncbi:hypothetical protein NDU88_000430, partial [Pleurodeles waltl]